MMIIADEKGLLICKDIFCIFLSFWKTGLSKATLLSSIVVQASPLNFSMKNNLLKVTFKEIRQQ